MSRQKQKKVSKSTIIAWIDELWYSDSVIANEMILIIFNYSEFSKSLNGSEDDQSRGHEDIEKGYEIIQIENDYELYLNDYVTSNDQINNHFY